LANTPAKPGEGDGAIFETVDLNEVQKHFGKNIQTTFKKNIAALCKTTGWPSINVLHLSSNRQGSGIPEMLYWWVELFNRLSGGETARARWEVPFQKQFFLDPVVLPSGHLLPADDVLPAFFEVTKKFSNALQANTRQLSPLPGKAIVRHDRLVLIRSGRQTEILNREELKLQVQKYYLPGALERLGDLKAEALAAEMVTEDDLALYQAVSKTLALHFQSDLEAQGYQIVLLHNFQTAGLIQHLRRILPGSMLIWRNHLATVDPTPVVWNFFAPLINQADLAVFHTLEYIPREKTHLTALSLPVLVHLPSLYPFSPKNCELKDLGMPVVKRVLAQYQRDYILVSKFNLKPKVEKAYLKITGSRISDTLSEAMLDSLTKASIRAAFMEAGRRPELESFISKAASAPEGLCNLVRELHGVDPKRPLFTQISRYDAFKDPLGTLKAFVQAYLTLVREKFPPEELPQFVLGGTLEEDDLGGFEELVRIFIYLENLKDVVNKETRGEKGLVQEDLCRQLRRDIFVLLLPSHDSVADALEINALQRTARAVIQKSLHEGFGLAVTEAMWKGVPVIGGNTGGIRLQIDHGTNGFLAGEWEGEELKDSVEDATQFIITYTKYPEVAARMGEMAKRKVTKEFLMPMNLNLILKKMNEFLVKHPPATAPAKKRVRKRA
jgi:glycosyltransferase involved in cell wall biosynthesis